MHQVIDYYHETLLESDEALAYLDKRGLNDRSLITRFKLGYANRTLAYRLPQKQYKAGKQLRGQLQTLGILRGSGHEHFNGLGGVRSRSLPGYDMFPAPRGEPSST